MRWMTTRWLTVVVVFVSSGISDRLQGGGAREYTFTELVAVGDSFRDAEGNEFEFAGAFEYPVLNNRGDLAFGVGLCSRNEGAPCEDLSGIFIKSRQGQMRLLARTGARAPGGGVFGPLAGFSLNELGDVAFTSGSAVYLFLRQSGEVREILAPGQPAPGGGTFVGCASPSINDLRDIAFEAVVSRGDDTKTGVFLLRLGRTWRALTEVVVPGDPASGGGIFDFAANPRISNLPAITFEGHVTADECIPLGEPFTCAPSVYLTGIDGGASPVARQGGPARGGGTYRFAFAPVITNTWAVAFIADLTPAPGVGERLGVFPGARPGDPMPGGGQFVTASFFAGGCAISNCYEVIFTGTLDSQTLDIDGDGVLEPDQGVFVWSEDLVRLVARTGTVLPRIGTVAALLPPALVESFPEVFPWPLSAVDNNDLGQAVFSAMLSDGRDVLVLATPENAQPCAPLFVRGDANADGGINLSDVLFVLNYLFRSGPAPTCEAAGDADDNGEVNLSDAIYALLYLFRGGRAIPPPLVCEVVLGADCEAFAACP